MQKKKKAPELDQRNEQKLQMCEICETRGPSRQGKILESSLLAGKELPCGVFPDECSTFLVMMKDIGIGKKQQHYIIKK